LKVGWREKMHARRPCQRRHKNVEKKTVRNIFDEKILVYCLLHEKKFEKIVEKNVEKNLDTTHSSQVPDST
jgi:hypothetical protein